MTRRADRALTVWQPWADLIVAGEKLVENRSRPTSYRGRLAIHAGKQFDHWGAEWIAEVPYSAQGAQAIRWPPVLGVLLGEVTLVDCVSADEAPPSVWSDEFSEPWKWLLADPVRYRTPIPHRGALGIWKVQV